MVKMQQCKDVINTIYLTQGDDSSAIGGTITITIDTDVPLDGYSAVFQLSALRWDFDDITSKELNITINAAQSASLPVGSNCAALKIFDADNRPKTIIRDIPVYVYPMVVPNGRGGTK